MSLFGEVWFLVRGRPAAVRRLGRGFRGEARALRLVGIDTGGTFTDLVFYDEDEKRMEVSKVPTIRGAEDAVFLEALRGLELATLGRITHGTTVGTNAILEGTGARTAMLTTRGFRDVLEIGRTQRLVPNSLFDAKFVRPRPVVPRTMRFEIDERVAPGGAVEVPVSEEGVAAQVARLEGLGVEAVAVCCLHSYANGENERRTAEYLRKFLPAVYLSLSHEVVRVPRVRAFFPRRRSTPLSARR